jgi:N-sulfoglucosamine sulfohydrolase
MIKWILPIMTAIVSVIIFWIIISGFRPAGEKSPPNILLAISDDQSYPHAGAYGFRGINTPGFDRIAEEGILFHNAFSSAPGCSPSRASLLTGRYIWELEDAGSHASKFPVKFITYTDLLAGAGYHVGYTGKGWGPGNWNLSGRMQNPAGKNYSGIRDTTVPEHISEVDYAANFESFLKKRKRKQPFCFWYGATEPHRRYSKGIGKKEGIRSEDLTIPPFLPDDEEVREDMADYLYEIQHFDRHLVRMIETLERLGELDNTVIIVTSDNGMPFPRAKANLYEYGFHMPLAIRWGCRINPGRVVDDLVSFADVAPTLLEIAGIGHPAEPESGLTMSGKSFYKILLSSGSGLLEPDRKYIYAGRERHSCSRWNNLSYPIRALRSHDYLYIKNFKPERWPAGAPVRYDEKNNLVAGFHDIDDFTEDFVFVHRNDSLVKRYFDLAVSKRPLEEFFDIRNDPGCLNNLADLPEIQEILETMRNDLHNRLIETGDPRVHGYGDIWETYERYNVMRRFPEPDWIK